MDLRPRTGLVVASAVVALLLAAPAASADEARTPGAEPPVAGALPAAGGLPAAGALSVAGALPADGLLAQALPVAGYSGANPFDCEIQHLGRTTDFPDPDADPFCVEYDKTRQNVTDLGVVDFLSKEPARVAAAVDKCFYYQRDHWHASVDQHHEETEVYSWDGAYYWDKARGAFGVFVEDFTVNNSSVDPTGLPGFPEEWKPYFGYGRGGVQVVGQIPVDPRCAKRARGRDPYV